MPQPIYPPAGPQSIGQVLDSGFRIFKVSVVSCLLFGALSMIAGQLPNIYFVASGRPLTQFGGGSPLWLALYLTGTLIGLTLVSALVFRQYGIATGQRLGTSVELSQALRRLPAYFGMMILTMLVIGVGPGILIGISIAALRAGGSVGTYSLAVVLWLAAAVLLVYFMTPLSLCGPSLLLDRKGPLQAIKYAFRLVRGNWWRTTVILTVTVVLIVVFYTVAMVVVGIVLPLAGTRDVAAVTAATGVVLVVLGSLGLPFFTAMVLATFGELKVRKEGLDLEQRVAGIAQA